MVRALSITEDDVAQAANDLLAAGREPSVRLVRERLGKGSNTTIDNMLKRVRTLLPVAAPKAAVAIVANAAPVAVAPVVDTTRLAEMEALLGEERGRVVELRRQIEALTGERDKALADLADALSKAKVAKAEATAANRAMAKAEETLEREALARAAAEEQVRRINKLMTADAAHVARLRAYLQAFGGADTLAQAEAGLAPADTDQLAAVARAAQAAETRDPKTKVRVKRGG